MADKKISELVSADALSGAELIETVQGGVNKRTTAQDIANLAPGAGHVIEDEGTPLTARTKLNFVGAGVTVTDDAGDDATVVTIDAGSGHTIQDDGTPVTDRANLNFAGAGVTVTDDAGNDATVITIDAGTTLFADLTDDPRDNALLEDELEALEAVDAQKANLAIEIRSITGSHTLDATDASNFSGGKSMHIKGDGSGTLTIPLQSVQAMPTGYNVMYSGFTAVVEGDAAIVTNPSSGSLTSSSTTAKYYLIRNGSDDWDVENGGAPASQVFVTQKDETAAHILDADDLSDVNEGKEVVFMMDVASAHDFTIPTNATQAFPVGSVIGIRQVGAGQTTVVGAIGVTLNAPLNAFKSAAQGALMFIEKTDTNTWYVNGETVI